MQIALNDSSVGLLDDADQVFDAGLALNGLVVIAHGRGGAPGRGRDAALNTTALPAATMLTMLPLSVGMEWVEGVMAPTTPKGVYSSSVMP